MDRVVIFCEEEMVRDVMVGLGKRVISCVFGTIGTLSPSYPIYILSIIHPSLGAVLLSAIKVKRNKNVSVGVIADCQGGYIGYNPMVLQPMVELVRFGSAPVNENNPFESVKALVQ